MSKNNSQNSEFHEYMEFNDFSGKSHAKRKYKDVRKKLVETVKKAAIIGGSTVLFISTAGALAKSPHYDSSKSLYYRLYESGHMSFNLTSDNPDIKDLFSKDEPDNPPVNITDTPTPTPIPTDTPTPTETPTPLPTDTPTPIPTDTPTPIPTDTPTPTPTPHEHAWKLSAHVDPGCETPGSDTFICDCGEAYSDEIDPKGHTPETIQEQPPTCEENGRTAYSVCKECGKELKSPTVIPATGHKVSNWTTDKEPTCSSEGTKSGICENCGERIAETIPKPDHTAYHIEGNPALEEKTFDPTCFEPGMQAGIWCTECGAYYIEPKELPPLDHIDENDDGICDRCEHLMVSLAIEKIFVRSPQEIIEVDLVADRPLEFLEPAQGLITYDVDVFADGYISNSPDDPGYFPTPPALIEIENFEDTENPGRIVDSTHIRLFFNANLITDNSQEYVSNDFSFVIQLYAYDSSKTYEIAFHLPAKGYEQENYDLKPHIIFIHELEGW